MFIDFLESFLTSIMGKLRLMLSYVRSKVAKLRSHLTCLKMLRTYITSSINMGSARTSQLSEVRPQLASHALGFM